MIPKLRPGPFSKNSYDGRRYAKAWFCFRIAEIISPRSFRGYRAWDSDKYGPEGPA